MAVDPRAENLRLRTALRDLVALSTIPAGWVGTEPPVIAAGLADVLVGSLHLDAERTAELRRITAELQTIRDASPVGIALFGRDQTVQRCNPAFERILGWTADEMVGRPMAVPTGHQEEWSALAQRLQRGEAFANVETGSFGKAERNSMPPLPALLWRMRREGPPGSWERLKTLVIVRAPKRLYGRARPI